ncbi:MAG: bifunctional metallophosphatase/5'-nucleotidase [Paludibacteraceae bacterium]|nr:bifunctional metallophosphatase/5'-nucleotidase [Paludibacteraceae bacterium]
MKYSKLLFLLLIVALAGCQRKQPIVILYENDAHCAVEGYARLAGQRDAERQHTPYVAIVSSGDFAQGNTVGSLTKGEAIVRIMNAVGYDYLTIGNHEFDYTVPQMQHLSEMLTAKTLCCNFSRYEQDNDDNDDDRDDDDLYPAYEVKDFGGTKVGFIGVATPSTFRSSTPTYFIDDNGNLLYNFHQTDTYECVQEAVNDAREEGAEIIIVLSHLGDDPEVAYSRGLIAATHGIDVVLDGHAHHVLNERLVNDRGDSVTLTSTGTKFAYIGRLTIDTDNRVTTELLPISDCHRVNQAVQDTVLAIQQELEARVNAPVGTTAFALADRDNQDHRLVRKQETNLGDFMADVARYTTGANIGVCNGGGLRAGLYNETITFGNIVSIWPFNNTMRVVECTGQQLLDAFEVSAANLPRENGDFMHVSGLRYTINPHVPTSVIWDDNRMFNGVGKTRRIAKMEVFMLAGGESDKLPYEQRGTWQQVNPNAVYTIGGQSYIIACSGASGMFAKMRLLPVEGEPVNDVDAVCAYIQAMGGTINDVYRRPQGRITIK